MPVSAANTSHSRCPAIKGDYRRRDKHQDAMPSLRVSLRLQPELSVSAELANRAAGARVHLPTYRHCISRSLVREEDQVFVKAIFAIPDKEMERQQPELSVSAELAKIVQHGLAYTSVRTVTAAVEVLVRP